jgi:hypothetical protein
MLYDSGSNPVNARVKRLAMKIVLLMLAACAAGFGATLSGVLVDERCYSAEERNVNPTSTLMAVNIDRDAEIHYCRPTAKSKTFGIVDHDGISFKLDAPGNAKAAGLIRPLAKPAHVVVTVTGTEARHVIQVDSISLAP